MTLRDNYTSTALAYYDQRRRTLVMRHGEDRMAEWESVIEGLLATRTGHLPPLEALLLMSDIYGQGQWHENQRHAQHRQVHEPDVPRLAEQAHLAYRQVLTGFGMDVADWTHATDATKEAWCGAVEEVLRRA